MNITEGTTRVKYAFLESFAVEITIIICHVIIMSSSVIGLAVNCLILCCIKRQKSLQTFTNSTLVNSCVVNIIGCTVLLPLRFILFGMFYDDVDNLTMMCQSASFFRSFCEIFQLSVLITISYERYHAVLLPFDKDDRFKRIVALNIISWCVALLYGSVSAALMVDSSIYVLCNPYKSAMEKSWPFFDSFVIFPFGIFTFTLVLIFYVCIIRALFKQSHKMLSHSKVRNRKIHPIESNIPTASTIDTTKTPTHARSKNIDTAKTNTATNTLTVPVKTRLSELKTASESTQTTTILGHSFVSNSHDITIKIESAGATDVKTTESAINETIGKVTGDKTTKTQSLSEKLEEVKTYEVYDADGSIRVEKNVEDNVAGAVCMFNPKNREHGKRKLEAKIAKNFAIVIGLFGIVWIPLPLFVICHNGTTILTEVEFHILVIISTISVTVYTINPVITIIMNRKIKVECIKIIKYFNVFIKIEKLK